MKSIPQSQVCAGVHPKSWQRNFTNVFFFSVFLWLYKGIFLFSIQIRTTLVLSRELMWIWTSVIPSGKTFPSICLWTHCRPTVFLQRRFTLTSWIRYVKCLDFFPSVSLATWENTGMLETAVLFNYAFMYFLLLCCNESSLFAKKYISCASLKIQIWALEGCFFSSSVFLLF